jgi:transcriptional regulator with PAS, ATPase and Fis domain
VSYFLIIGKILFFFEKIYCILDKNDYTVNCINNTLPVITCNYMNMTEEQLLKKIAELERENRRLKESQNLKVNIDRSDAFNSIRNLLERDTQSYQALASKVGISDRTLRMLAG